jgi:hypothetical protein
MLTLLAGLAAVRVPVILLEVQFIEPPIIAGTNELSFIQRTDAP